MMIENNDDADNNSQNENYKTNNYEMVIITIRTMKTKISSPTIILIRI